MPKALSTLKCLPQAQGCTLAELLLSLAILGVIAAFTIPKILTAQQAQKNKALFKETIATFNQALQEGITSGNLNATTPNWLPYMQTKIQYLKYCNSAVAGGCWSGSSDIGWNSAGAGGMVLPNGVYVTDLESGAGGGDGFIVDVNGPDGPNLDGQDQIALFANWGSPTVLWGTRLGQIAADSGSPTSVSYFQQIFN